MTLPTFGPNPKYAKRTVKNRYKVIGTGQHYSDLNEAVRVAKLNVQTRQGHFVVVEDVVSVTVVAIVTDDANGLKVQKLKGWPVGIELEDV